MAQTINQAGLALIRKYESLHLLCFDDGTGIATIGYGHTQTVKPADIGKKKITKKRAERLLKKDILFSERAVERYINVKLNENQFTALVCFTFNSGGLSLKESTLRCQLNTGDYNSVPAELARWVKSDGKTLASLIKRRLAESDLFTRSVGDAVRDDFISSRRPDTPDDNYAHIITGYLSDKNIILERGSVDDNGSINYLYLNQNVPDGYVVALQNDMIALGFFGTAVDGAFGIKTRSSLMVFQYEAKIDVSGIVDNSTKDTIILWLENGYSKNNLPHLNHFQ